MLLNIQILRFIAAMAVAVGHTYNALTPPAYANEWPKLLTYFAVAGFAGVDLFFVISGAVMAESTRNLVPGARTGLRFGATRFARIYIGWWPFFALYLAASPLHGQLAQAVSLLGSFFLLPLRLDQYLVAILWTLSFELYFYLVLSGLLVMDRKRIRLALWAWGAAIAAFTIYSVVVGLYTPARFGDISLFHTFLAFPLVLEFIAGFLLCDYLRARPQTRWQTPALITVLLVTAAIAYQRRGGLVGGLGGFYHAPERALLVGGACCAIVACALLWREPAGWFGRTLARLGDASYAIYLGHMFIVILFYKVVEQLGISPSFKIPLQVLALSLVVAYAWAHYRCIEHPLYLRARNLIKEAFR